MKKTIVFDGSKIGYQFNADSMGKRVVERTIKQDANGKNYVTYNGIKWEVQMVYIPETDKFDYDTYEAIRQYPQEIEVVEEAKVCNKKECGNCAGGQVSIGYTEDRLHGREVYFVGSENVHNVVLGTIEEVPMYFVLETCDVCNGEGYVEIKEEKEMKLVDALGVDVKIEKSPFTFPNAKVVPVTGIREAMLEVMANVHHTINDESTDEECDKQGERFDMARSVLAVQDGKYTDEQVKFIYSLGGVAK